METTKELLKKMREWTQQAIELFKTTDPKPEVCIHLCKSGNIKISIKNDGYLVYSCGNKDIALTTKIRRPKNAIKEMDELMRMAIDNRWCCKKFKSTMTSSYGKNNEWNYCPYCGRDLGYEQ